MRLLPKNTTKHAPGTSYSFEYLHPADLDSVSVVIPVYNSWKSAARCIGSLRRQRLAPLEIMVLDDGSNHAAPTAFKKMCKAEAVKFVRIRHRGVSAARNKGLQLARGQLVLFLDSDCYADQSAVERLAAAAKEYSQSSTFQLCVRGDKSTLIGAAEEIDNSAAQVVFRQQDGSIKWLNTAGFAIRRAYAELLMPLFDERAIRAQDTLLLAKLLEKGQSPPRYLPGSIVFHSPQMTLLGYICKAYDEHVDSLKAYSLMAQMNLTIRMSLQERGEILRHFWFKASQLRHGWFAFAVVMTRYLIRMSARLLCFGTRKR